MITIKDFIKYDNANCIEVTWVDEIVLTTLNEFEDTVDTIEETVIHCQAYADTQIDMLRVDALKYNTPLDEYEDIIKEVKSNVKPLSDEQLQEIEQNRIICIKSKAKELIEAKYPTYKQMNILMSNDEAQIKTMNDYISAIRDISNKAEKTTLNYDEVDWNI